MTQYNSIPTLERRLQELERRLGELETSTRLSAAGIGSGGLVISDGGSITLKDEDGNISVRLGSAGLEQRVGSTWIPLLQLASGVKSATNNSTVSVSAGANATSGWSYPSPSTVFTTYTGNVTVISAANIIWNGYKSAVSLGYRIRSEDGTTQVEASSDRSSVIANPSDLEATQSATRIDTMTLPPGNYILDAAYSISSGVSEASSAQFSARTVMVFPY